MDQAQKQGSGQVFCCIVNSEIMILWTCVTNYVCPCSDKCRPGYPNVFFFNLPFFYFINTESLTVRLLFYFTQCPLLNACVTGKPEACISGISLDLNLLCLKQ